MASLCDARRADAVSCTNATTSSSHRTFAMSSGVVVSSSDRSLPAAINSSDQQQRSTAPSVCVEPQGSPGSARGAPAPRSRATACGPAPGRPSSGCCLCLKVSFTFSPAFFRSASAWSVLPSASVSLRPVTRPRPLLSCLRCHPRRSWLCPPHSYLSLLRFTSSFAHQWSAKSSSSDRQAARARPGLDRTLRGGSRRDPQQHQLGHARSVTPLHPKYPRA